MKTPGTPLTLAAGVLLLSCQPSSRQQLGTTGTASRQAPAPAAAPTPPSPCGSSHFCRPEALRGFAGVGYPCAPPILLERVAPDLTDVAKPHPRGVVILDIGISTHGEVVSACVVRGVRGHFDCAVQAAVRKWRYTVARLWGEPVGLRMTVAVRTPAPDPSVDPPNRAAPRRSLPDPACQ